MPRADTIEHRPPDDTMTLDAEVRPGVAAIVYDDRRRVLLHRRHVGRGWAPPSGSVEAGEFLVAALHREIHEETRLAVSVSRLVAIYSDPAIQVITYPDGGRVHFVTALFACDVTGGSLQGSSEADRWEWFRPDDLPDGLLDYARVWLKDAFAAHDAVVVR